MRGRERRECAGYSSEREAAKYLAKTPPHMQSTPSQNLPPPRGLPPSPTHPRHEARSRSSCGLSAAVLPAQGWSCCRCLGGTAFPQIIDHASSMWTVSPRPLQEQEQQTRLDTAVGRAWLGCLLWGTCKRLGTPAAAAAAVSMASANVKPSLHDLRRGSRVRNQRCVQ